MAGAPGFEPGIAGPKPAALPLGYAPPRSSIGTATTAHHAALQTAAPAKPARPPRGIASDAAALGYAPPRSSIGTATSRHRAVIQTLLLAHRRGRLLRSLAVIALGVEVDQRDRGDDGDGDDRGGPRQEPHDRHEHRRGLRGGEDPGELPTEIRAVIAARTRPERDRDGGEHVDEPVRDDAHEGEQALRDGDPERDLDPVLPEGGAGARHRQ